MMTNCGIIFLFAIRPPTDEITVYTHWRFCPVVYRPTDQFSLTGLAQGTRFIRSGAIPSIFTLTVPISSPPPENRIPAECTTLGCPLQ